MYILRLTDKQLVWTPIHCYDTFLFAKAHCLTFDVLLRELSTVTARHVVVKRAAGKTTVYLLHSVQAALVASYNDSGGKMAEVGSQDPLPLPQSCVCCSACGAWCSAHFFVPTNKVFSPLDSQQSIPRVTYVEPDTPILDESDVMLETHVCMLVLD